MGVRMLLIAFFPDRSSLPWQRNLKQNWLLLGLRKRFSRDFCSNKKNFREWAIQCCILHFSRPTLVAMVTEFGTKYAITACVRDFREIVRLHEVFLKMDRRNFQEWAIECCQLHFFPTYSRCHGNGILFEICYNSACLKNYREIFALIRKFLGMGRQIGTEWAITRFA